MPTASGSENYWWHIWYPNAIRSSENHPDGRAVGPSGSYPLDVAGRMRAVVIKRSPRLNTGNGRPLGNLAYPRHYLRFAEADGDDQVSTKLYPVTADKDHLAKLSKASPVAALAELIWNALDADAMKVRVILQEGALDEVIEVLVVDDGAGLHIDDAEDRFTRIGGSWKKTNGISEIKGRFLHGREGRGRFKALSIGRIATWNIVFNDSINLLRYQIELIGDDPEKIKVSDPEKAEAGAFTGVSVRIEEVRKARSTFTSQAAIDELSETFAPYLTDYKDVTVEIDGVRLDPDSHIKSKVSFPLPASEFEGQQYTATLDIIEWHDHNHRTLFLANERGAPLIKTRRKFHVGDVKFTAYVKSALVTELQERETLDLAELNLCINYWLNEAQDVIKGHFDTIQAEERRGIVESWKHAEVYPFAGEPSGVVEQAERQVFDMVAVKVAAHVPEFRNGTKEGQALHLRLLRNAIEKSPEDLQLILEEVLRLPPREIANFASLLKDATLTSVINASAVVTDRLKFLMALQTLLYQKDYKNNFKERTQLHRIVAHNPWLFGEEWSISVDDRSLTQVLIAHRKLLNDEIVIDEPVKHVSKKRGIVDLMLSKTIRRHGSTDPAHLIVELKAPKVKISEKEITQITDYARSVSEDPRFVKGKTEWTFWVLSNEITDAARFRLHNEAEGLLLDKGHLKIYVKLWSEVLEDNRSRMQFFKEQLEFEAQEEGALAHITERYREFLEGVTVEEGDQSDEEIQQFEPIPEAATNG